MTRFLAEQLTTAHWFDQRRTRELLRWRPDVEHRRGLRPAVALVRRRAGPRHRGIGTVSSMATGSALPGVAAERNAARRTPPGWVTTWMRPAALASLVANIGIVVTGGVVRLTGSGLGCPTWPRCTDEAFVPHRALGVHSAIEFGNRLLTFVVAFIAIATFLIAWRYGRTAVLRLAFLLALGVPAQAVIGGVTVLTDLNPWIVSLHLLVSLAMVGLAVIAAAAHRRGRRPAAARGPGRDRVADPRRVRRRAGRCSTSAPWSPAAGRTPATWTRPATASTRARSASCTPTSSSCSSG